MAAVNPWIQFVGTVTVGLASGYIGARANERAGQRRYNWERHDAMLPAVREWALLLMWEGEVAAQQRFDNGPSEKRMDLARAEFDKYRHDLPLGLQRELDSSGYDNPIDYGEALIASAKRLHDWVETTVVKRQANRRHRLEEAGRRLQATSGRTLVGSLLRGAGNLAVALSRI